MPVIIGCTLIFLIWFSIKRSKAEKLGTKTSEAFWQKERRSNTTKKQDISSLCYLKIPLDMLPFHTDCSDSIKRCQNQLLSLSEKKILNLTNLTNTELKLQYGTANLPLLSEYDTNFLTLCRILNQWGSLLYEEGLIEDAQIILSYAISIGSDISRTFLLLGTICQETNDASGLSILQEKALALSSIMKEPILNGLRELEQAE